MNLRPYLRSCFVACVVLALAACGSDDATVDSPDGSSGGRPTPSDTDASRPINDADDSEEDSGADEDVRQSDAGGAQDVVSPPRDAGGGGGTDTASDTSTSPVDGGFGDIREDVRQAIADAVEASSAHTDTFCACYQSGAPYNGSESACRAELDGISILPQPCDTTIALQYPDDALAFYQCRRQVADDLNTCFQPCSTRQGAILGCVPTAATAAVACGNGRSEAFIAAYEACHP
jgi:hypothetical protein